MYDAGKVIVGLGIFVVLFTSPVWYNLSMGQPVREPDLTPARAMAKECVQKTDYMRARHMDLLEAWRLEVVREADRFLTDEMGVVKKWDNGAPMHKSLSNTCLKCHSNYQDFCYRCHMNSQVDLSCWNCHLNFSEGVK